MGLTSAMYTGLTGLNANQTRIQTIGHNVANVNTTAFRGSRTLFQTQFSQLMSPGTPPGNDSGGTNPIQMGQGVAVGSTQRLLTPATLEMTGLPSDLAIEGNGYFVVRDAAGRQFYTRDGSFNLNADKELVNAAGQRLRGYGVDTEFNIIPGTLQDIVIPIGIQSVARSTETVVMDGDLSAAETISSAGAASASQQMVTGGGGPAVDGTALIDLRSATAPGVPLFADGETITVSGVTKGERELPPKQFVVGTDGSTLGEFASWLQSQFGIQTEAGLPGNPGVVVENGALVVRSNAGEPNAIEIGNADIMSTNPGTPIPFQFTQNAWATGTGVFTSFMVYDSLGAPVPVNATFTLEQTPNSGAVWRFYLESGEADSPNRALGTGTLNFDPEGNFVSATGNQVTMDHSNSGAATPITFTLDFASVNGLSTQTSEMIMYGQDGYPPGTLNSFNVDPDGTIQGAFSNGMTHTLGQVVLASFANEGGLVAESENLFSVGPNSGPATITAPGTLATGLVRGGALEMSNVEIAQEFIGLITSSTAFQANSRVISTSAEMLEQLLLTLR
jgi:flagellar hook protein FlgE